MTKYQIRLLIVSAVFIGTGTAGLVYEKDIHGFLKRYDGTVPWPAGLVPPASHHSSFFDIPAKPEDAPFYRYLQLNEKDYAARESQRLNGRQSDAAKAAFAPGSPLLAAKKEEK